MSVAWVTAFVFACLTIGFAGEWHIERRTSSRLLNLAVRYRDCCEAWRLIAERWQAHAQESRNAKR